LGETTVLPNGEKKERGRDLVYCLVVGLEREGISSFN